MLSEAQRECLEALAEWAVIHVKHGTPEWARPMDCGGSNGSHHSAALAALARKGYAERTQRRAWMSRGSWQYRITEAGRLALANQGAGE